MKNIIVALKVELMKAWRSRVFFVSLVFFLFIGIMMGLLVYLAMHPEIAGRSSALEMKTSFLGEMSWMGFYGLMDQVVLTIVVIGSGIITGWVFGREFSDRTMKDLIALPVSRSAIVGAKLLVLVAWSLILSLLVLAAAMGIGFLIHLPGWDISHFMPFLGRYLVSTVLNILLITPVALVACVGRGYILPIAFVVLIMIMTQFIFVAIPQFTPWFPWALPALVSRVAGAGLPSPGFISYIIYFATVLGFLSGTIVWWRRADQR